MAGEQTEDLVELLALASAQKSLSVPYVNTPCTSTRSVPLGFEEQNTEDLASLLMASSTASTQASPRFSQHAAGHNVANAPKKDFTELLNSTAKLSMSQKSNFTDLPRSQFHSTSAKGVILTDLDEAALRQTSFSQISSIAEVAEPGPQTEDLAELLASVSRVAVPQPVQSFPSICASSVSPLKESTEDLAELLADTAFKTAEAKRVLPGTTPHGFRHSTDSLCWSSSASPDVEPKTEDLAELLMNALAVPEHAPLRMETGRTQAPGQNITQTRMGQSLSSRFAAMHAMQDNDAPTEDLVELLAASARVSSGRPTSCSSSAPTPRKAVKQKRVQFAEVDYVWLSVCQALPQNAHSVMSRVFSALDHIKRAAEMQYTQCFAAAVRASKRLPDLFVPPGQWCAATRKNTEQTLLGLLAAAGVLVVKMLIHKIMSVLS